MALHASQSHRSSLLWFRVSWRSVALPRKVIASAVLLRSRRWANIRCILCLMSGSRISEALEYWSRLMGVKFFSWFVMVVFMVSIMVVICESSRAALIISSCRSWVNAVVVKVLWSAAESAGGSSTCNTSHMCWWYVSRRKVGGIVISKSPLSLAGTWVMILCWLLSIHWRVSAASISAASIWLWML